MDIFDRKDIEEIPLGTPFFRRKAESFLLSNGLRLEDVDSYYAILDGEGEILAGGGLKKDIIKCVAVDSRYRSEGLLAPVISHLISLAASHGYDDLRVFTKPENTAVFESLGFHTIAAADRAVLMESGRGLETYKEYLRSFYTEGSGVIVMNADPFTLGHLYLIEKASTQVERLFVIPVSEDAGRFSASERTAMIRAAASRYATVLDGSRYCISYTTFPTYFLKDLSDAAKVQMSLDLDLFARHIAPSLGASVRFVGSEPLDALTAEYNRLMGGAFHCVEIPRLCDGEGPLSASRVRLAIDKGQYRKAASITPPTSHPYILASMVDRALRMELDTPLKPGLVGPDGTGAHSDMDYDMMGRSVEAIRRSFGEHLPELPELGVSGLGKAVEADALAATGGVNTHRGAIFALGLALLAADSDDLAAAISGLAANVEAAGESHGAEAVSRYGVRGALQMAKEGYPELFAKWLPYYAEVKTEQYGLQKTLLCIMSTLDDTCVIHRVGYERAQEVKREAGALLERFSANALSEMCRSYAAERISPGGAADMLALTIFMDSIID